MQSPGSPGGEKKVRRKLPTLPPEDTEPRKPRAKSAEPTSHAPPAKAETAASRAALINAEKEMLRRRLQEKQHLHRQGSAGSEGVKAVKEEANKRQRPQSAPIRRTSSVDESSSSGRVRPPVPPKPSPKPSPARVPPKVAPKPVFGKPKPPPAAYKAVERKVEKEVKVEKFEMEDEKEIEYINIYGLDVPMEVSLNCCYFKCQLYILMKFLWIRHSGGMPLLESVAISY